MRKRWGLQLAAPITCAALLIGCGGSDGVEPRAQRPLTNAPDDKAGQAESGQAQAQTVGLSGCLEVGPGTDQYVLRSVRFEPDHADPQRDTTAPGAQQVGITEGAWVRLDGRERAEELRKYAGLRVTVTGMVTDRGNNTIGTSGAAGVPNAAGDTSQAASQGHYSEKVKQEAGRIGRDSMADGTAPQVKVTALQSTGERCPQEERPEKR
jgi:hypothetical protein